MADNNEKYYAPTGDEIKQSFAPTTYASSQYADGGGYYNGGYYNPEAPKSTDAFQQAVDEVVLGELKERDDTSRGDPNAPSGKKTDRTAENNYGYESFGTVGDIAGVVGRAIGGPVGAAISAPGRLAGISNLSAVQAARKDLGLATTEVGAKQVAGSFAKGSKNTKVGTVNIGQATYEVSLDPKEVGKINKTTGVATISPETAKQLAAENQQAITEVEAKPGAPKEKGIVGKAIDKAKETLTGVKAESVTPGAKPSTAPTPSTPSLGTAPAATPGYNPAAPGPTTTAATPTERSITPGLGLGNLAPTRDVTATAPTGGIVSGLGGVVGVGKRDTTNVPGLRDKTNVQNVSPEQRGTIASSTPTGRGRYATPEMNTMQTVANTVADTLGPGYGLSITSGTYTPEQAQAVEAARARATAEAKAKGYNKAKTEAHVKSEVGKVGGIGSPRHSTTLAGDYTITDLDTGMTVTDPKQVAAVAESLHAQGLSVGYGANYMGNATIHADDTRPSAPNTWGGYGFSPSTQASAQAAAQQRAGLASYSGIGVPGSRQYALDTLGTPSTQAIARNMYDTNIGTPSTVTAFDNRYDTMSPTMAAAQALNAPATMSQGLAAMNQGYTPGTAMSPANFSAVGMGYQYSPDQIGRVSMAIAGELGPQALRGLAVGTPQSINETAAIMGTIDNRVSALTNVGYTDPVGQALTAYDSVTKGFAKNTTAQNYAQYGQTVQDTVKGILDGSINAKNTAQQATHYANMDVASPSWAKTESFNKTETQVGAHTFGTPDTSMKAAGINNPAGYGTGYGPAGAKGVTGASGMTHSPGSMYGGTQNPSGIGDMGSIGTSATGKTAGMGTNALGGGLGFGGGYVDSGARNTAGSTAPADGKKGSETTNSGLGASSSANGNTGGTSSSANGNTGGSGEGGASTGGSDGGKGSGGSDGRGGSDGGSGKGGGEGGSRGGSTSGGDRDGRGR